MPLTKLMICFLCCTIASNIWAESDSNAASFAALQMRLLLTEQDEAENKPIATSDIETNAIQKCNEKVEKVHSLLAFIPSADQAYGPEGKHALSELLQLSKNSVFDQQCGDWLHDILAHFNAVKLKHEDYKQYLYSVLAANENEEVGTLAVAALQYSLIHGALTLEEWQYLKAALRFTNHQDLKQVVSLISQAALVKTQTETVFKQQADELLTLATAGELGMPLKVKPGYVIGLILANVQRDFPDQFMLIYRKYHKRIVKPARLEKYIRSYVSNSLSPERYQLLSLFLADIYSSDVKLNKRDANKLFAMLQKLRPLESAGEQLLTPGWGSILTDNERIISDIVQHSSAKQSEKDDWLNIYAQKQTKVSQLPL